MSESDTLLSALRDLDPYDFEKFVGQLWEERGWKTSVSAPSADQGIDVMASRQFPYKEKVAIQAKRYGPNSRVGGPDIQQYASIKQKAGVDQVVVVTTGGFTAAAEDRAEELNVKCINGERLVAFIQELDSEELVSNLAPDSAGEGGNKINTPSVSTPNLEVEVIGLLSGSEIAEFSSSSQIDLNGQLRGGGLSEREAIILEVTSIDSTIQFDTHKISFESEEGHEYDSANSLFIGYFEQSLPNEFNMFNDTLSPKQTKRYISVTDTIPDGITITNVAYDGQFSFSLDFTDQVSHLRNEDPREVI